MISRERFEYLKKETQIVFYILNTSVSILRLDETYGISTEEYNKTHNCKPQFYHLGHVYQNICDADKIFETKEDAEFALRYKQIPKTEYLDLPTWKEFNKDNFGIKFYNKSREFCLHRVRHSASDKNPLWKIDLYESYGDDEDTVAWEKSWDLTKENYSLACEFCKKLWLGEEV